MKNTTTNRIILAFLLVAFHAFAQGPERFAVYVSGASEAGVNKSLGNKLAAAIAQNSGYAEIGDMEAFYNELSGKPDGNISQTVQAAKRHGADIVCAVSLTEVFGAYSISARMIKTADSQVIKTVSLEHSLKSLDDLASTSSRLAAQLMGVQPASQDLPAQAAAAPAPEAPAQQCKETHNINELLAKIQHGFPAQLSDCATKLAKDIALSKVPFSKTPAPEPKSYMTQCTMDGIKGRLPEGFPGIDKAMDDTQKFLQTVLNTALTGGAPNPAALSKAASDMSGLLNGIKNLGAGNPCIVDEPYEYAEPVKEEEEAEIGVPKQESEISVGGIIVSIAGIIIMIIAIASLQ